MKDDVLSILKVAAYIVMFVLSIIAMFDGGMLASMFGLYEGGRFVGIFTYMFIHANPLHLLINCVMLFRINRFLEGKDFFGKNLSSLITYCISFLTAPACMYSLPTIGMSGYACAKYGIALSMTGKTNIIKSLVTFAIYNAVMYLIGHFNCLLHFYCIAVGLIYGHCAYKH